MLSALGHGDWPGRQTIVAACAITPLVDRDAFLVDGRDLDPAESEMLARSDVVIEPVSEIAAAVPPDRPLYVHVDIDMFDPDAVPAVSCPAPGGPSAAAGERIASPLLG